MISGIILISKTFAKKTIHLNILRIRRYKDFHIEYTVSEIQNRTLFNLWSALTRVFLDGSWLYLAQFWLTRRGKLSPKKGGGNLKKTDTLITQHHCHIHESLQKLTDWYVTNVGVWLGVKSRTPVFDANKEAKSIRSQKPSYSCNHDQIRCKWRELYF